MNADELYQRGRALFESGDLEQALTLFDQAVEADPSLALPHNGRAAVLLQRGEVECGMGAANEALRLDPQLGKARANRGEAYRLSGDNERALADFNEALRLDSSLSFVIELRGLCLYEMQRYEEAIEDFTRCLGQDPGLASVLAMRGLAHHCLHEHLQALADFNKSIQIDKSSAWIFDGRGCVHVSIRDFDSAICDFDEALRLDPQYANAWLNRGRAWQRKGDPEQALDDLAAALRIAPELAAAFEERGHCLFDLRRYDEAVDELSRSLALDPGAPSLFAKRGLARHYLEDYEAAISDYDRSIQLDPTSAWAFNCRGTAYCSIEDYGAAISDYDESLRLDSQYANAWHNRGRAYFEIDEPDRALSDLDEAIRLDPQHADSYFRRAKVWEELDDLQHAIDDLTVAIQLDPAHRKAYRRRGRIWDDLGEPEQADRDLERAEELSTDHSAGGQTMLSRKQRIQPLLEKHFAPTPLDDITITERRFPARVRADLQRAINRLVSEQANLLHFCGVRKLHHHEGVNFSELLIPDRNDPALSVPPQFEEIDIGEEVTVKCLKDGLWLLEQDDHRFALFLEPPSHFGRMGGLRFQIATANDETGTAISETFFKRLEQAILESSCYRGKILSLTLNDRYSGVSTGITVHKLKPIDREQVILPRKTLELLERNVIQFVGRRSRLNELGISTKKGLLFYGPPGTGKTHTIHYLAGALQGHTTLLISAEQVGLLAEYMTLARLLQPSIVVLEDVDLIARDRMQMNSPCEEVLLNKLLNEMDGLQPDADILFILTTNRPEALELALASRPGRIDQAIEFPLPDAEGRAKLVRLYSHGATVTEDVADATVRKTENVSGAFIKELMRRAMQFHLERADSSTIEIQDVEHAIEELLFSGGTLNRKLLGAEIGRNAG